MIRHHMYLVMQALRPFDIWGSLLQEMHDQVCQWCLFALKIGPAPSTSLGEYAWKAQVHQIKIWLPDQHPKVIKAVSSFCMNLARALEALTLETIITYDDYRTAKAHLVELYELAWMMAETSPKEAV